MVSFSLPVDEAHEIVASQYRYIQDLQIQQAHDDTVMALLEGVE